jgi:hypothetical protein
MKYFATWRYSTWILGLGLIVFAEIDPVNLWKFIPLYSAGFLLALSSFFFFWIGAAGAKVKIRNQPLPREVRLNGHILQACELNDENGNPRFRLLSGSILDPIQEAALIRYMVNEGLVEEIWPKASGRIEAEANWAFYR